MRKNFIVLLFCIIVIPLGAQQQTYCNPLNIDYSYTPIADNTTWGKHRAMSEPVIVNYKTEFYLFSSNQNGYWWSSDLSDWHFVSRSFLPDDLSDNVEQSIGDLYAPAAWVQGDALYVFGSAESGLLPIWYSTNPKENEWKQAVNHFIPGGWNPDFFVDTDGRMYLYSDKENAYSIYGIEIQRNQLLPIGTPKELVLTKNSKKSYPGDEDENNRLSYSAIEGPWMTKYKNKYYLQWSNADENAAYYGDNVAIGDNPLGPFTIVSLPLSVKAGGFIRGAGNGATFLDFWDYYWHVATMSINVKNSYERRIGLWPAGFDKDGVMYCNTAFGDYPQYLLSGDDHVQDRFTGWMLLNYNKPVQVSSTLGAYTANNLVDEDIKTYWSAATGGPNEWLISDLGEVSTVYALQINYADQDAEISGKLMRGFHQYRLHYSVDGKTWKLLLNKCDNEKDIPHEYVALPHAVKARYLKMENVNVPTGKFAISGFRVFGLGQGNKPDAVKELTVSREPTDRGNSWLRWQPVDDAYAYNIYIGQEPGKLYNCIMVYGANEYYYQGMDKEKPYYFAIEALNENGVSLQIKSKAL